MGPLRIFLAIACMCWLSACGASTTAAQQPAPAQPDEAPATARPQQAVGHCGAHEVAVFSCTIKGSNKVMSLCLADDKEAPAASLRYAFGVPGKPELAFPSPQSPPMRGGFKQAHLMFAGSTGGYAYSFVNADTKYTIYSISGANGLADSGVVVTPADSRSVTAALTCDNGTLVEGELDKVKQLDRLLERDEELESRGLPVKE